MIFFKKYFIFIIVMISHFGSSQDLIIETVECYGISFKATTKISLDYESLMNEKTKLKFKELDTVKLTQFLSKYDMFYLTKKEREENSDLRLVLKIKYENYSDFLLVGFSYKEEMMIGNHFFNSRDNLFLKFIRKSIKSKRIKKTMYFNRCR